MLVLLSSHGTAYQLQADAHDDNAKAQSLKEMEPYHARGPVPANRVILDVLDVDIEEEILEASHEDEPGNYHLREDDRRTERARDSLDAITQEDDDEQTDTLIDVLVMPRENWVTDQTTPVDLP